MHNMTDHITAMKQALEALGVATTPLNKDRQTVIQAQAALRQAIEQTEKQAHTDHPARHWDRTCPACIEQAEKQEPVAWLVRDYVDGFRYVSSTENPSGTIAGLSEPLYTAPPRKEWVGLTEDEIVGHTCECVDDGTFNMKCAIDFANFIQETLKRYNT